MYRAFKQKGMILKEESTSKNGKHTAVEQGDVIAVLREQGAGIVFSIFRNDEQLFFSDGLVLPSETKTEPEKYFPGKVENLGNFFFNILGLEMKLAAKPEILALQTCVCYRLAEPVSESK